jgi:catechol 2,3-dioxygenase-like lactoylglutathione lyase family enzyme
MEAAVAFYTQKMGFREAFRTTNDQGQPALVFMQTNRNTFIELGQASAQRPAGFTHIGVHVESMPQAVALFQQRGLTVSEPRLSVPVGSTQANITDPNGIRVELTELPVNSLQRKAMESWK